MRKNEISQAVAEGLKKTVFTAVKMSSPVQVNSKTMGFIDELAFIDTRKTPKHLEVYEDLYKSYRLGNGRTTNHGSYHTVQDWIKLAQMPGPAMIVRMARNIGKSFSWDQLFTPQPSYESDRVIGFDFTMDRVKSVPISQGLH